MTCVLCLGTTTHVQERCVCRQPIGVPLSKTQRRERAAYAALCHALVVGSSLGNLRLWCGRGVDDVSNRDTVAGSPEVVTCEDCIRKMRMALPQLVEWVPRLKVET